MNREHISLTNFIAVALSIVAFPYVFIFRSQSVLMANIVIVIIFLFISILILNHYKFYMLAKYILLFLSNSTAAIYAIYFGRDAGVHFLFFAYIGLPFIIFEFNQKKKILCGCLISIVCLIFTEIYFVLAPVQNTFPSSFLRFLYYTALVFVSSLILAYLIQFINKITSFNKELESKKSEIEIQNTALSKSNSLLETTKNKLQTEYQKAALTQQQFLPNEMPTIEGYKVEHFFKGAYGVSGDFYDFKQFGFLTKFVVADVMSKSLSAAFITAHLYSIFRTLVSVETSPAKVLTIINQAFVDGRHEYEKAAAFAFDLDSKTNTITYSNACIGVAYLISAGTITELDYCGFMTGGERTEVYEEKQIQMQDGDILLIASDGLEDIVLKDGSRFGNETLLELIEVYLKDRQSNGGLRDFIVSHIASVADLESILADDIVLLVVERSKVI